MLKLLLNRYTATAYVVLLVISMVAYLGDPGIEKVYVIGFRGDYVIHMFVYIPWMSCCALILGSRFNAMYSYIVGLAVVVGLEMLQSVIPYRGYNINDLIAGLIGVTISWGVWLILKRWLR